MMSIDECSVVTCEDCDRRVPSFLATHDEDAGWFCDSCQLRSASEALGETKAKALLQSVTIKGVDQ
jgi:hypothetical protein